MGFPDTPIDLRHLVPEGPGLRRKVYFQVLQPFTYEAPDGRVVTIPAHDLAAEPPSRSATDLASVPSPLWGLIASYGRQSRPALLHDFLCVQARLDADDRDEELEGATDAGSYRRAADWLFWQALRDENIGPVERTLMWAAVRAQAMGEFERGWLAVFAGLVVAGILVVWSGLDVVLAWLAAWHPPFRPRLEAVWPDASLLVPWPAMVPLIGLVAVGLLVWIVGRRDVIVAAFVAAPGLYVAGPVGLANVVGLVLLWLASRVVYAPIVAVRWVLRRLDPGASGVWSFLRRLLDALLRERKPEIGPTNSM